MNNNHSKEVLDLAESIQKECNNWSEDLQKISDHVTYEASTNTYIFVKLAEYELRILELEGKVKSFEQMFGDYQKPKI